MAAVPTPAATPTLSTQAQAQVTAFNASLTPDQQTNFATALNGSPTLIAQINSAVAANQLNGFSLLAAGTHAGGQFNPATKTMELPASIITSPASGAFNPAEVTFVMGHEIQHAVNAPTASAALTTFATEVNRIAQTPQTTHDYTAALNTMLTANRNDEATAHIAGFNATVGMVRSTNPTPSLEDIYRANPARMQDFIVHTPATPGTPASPGHAATPATPASYALRSGLTLNADMSMTPDAANTAAMGQHYFDKPASVSRLGHNGDSNYQNYYAANLVGYIAQVERFHAPANATAGITPQLTLDMTTLRMSEAQLERNGLNLGTAAGRQPYVDSGTTPPTAGHFDHTIGTHRHVPIDLPNALPDMPPPPTLQQSAHPALRQAMDAMDRSPNIAAADFGTDRERVAAGVALHAARHGLSPDHVVLDDRRTQLIAVQGELNDPAARLSPPLAVADALRADPSALPQRLESLQQTQQTLQPSARDMPIPESPNQDGPRPPR